VAPHSTCPIKDPPEAYTLVSVALQRMAETHSLEKPIQVLQAHYVLNGKAKEKAPWIGVSLPQYWNHLHTAHAFIAGAGCWVPKREGLEEVYIGMSLQAVELYERARAKWPNEPLVVFDCGGQIEILPIGARLTSFTVIRILGIINADDSATTLPLDERVRPMWIGL
jgi:hypothetical protein